MFKESAFVLVVAALIGLGMREAEAITFDDGEFHMIDWVTDDTVYVRDSSFGDVTTANLVDGGEVWGDFDVFDYSEIIITGGYVYDDVIANDHAIVTISGGLIGNGLRAHDNSRVYISGGQIAGEYGSGGLHTFTGNSLVTIYGTGFNYPYGPIPDELGTLTGTLLSGELINWDFDITRPASIVLVPEPATISLLLGGIGLWLVRRRC